jgi:NAD(P)-dependent dehydrogenase (short-subunit alcohol dehydrogenase family)
MDLHLEGKLALVSGSTAGIGLAIAAPSRARARA